MDVFTLDAYRLHRSVRHQMARSDHTALPFAWVRPQRRCQTVSENEPATVSARTVDGSDLPLATAMLHVLGEQLGGPTVAWNLSWSALGRRRTGDVGTAQRLGGKRHEPVLFRLQVPRALLGQVVAEDGREVDGLW